MIWRPQKALILSGDKVLLLKRSSDSYTHPGTWDLPGGKMDEGEDPLETVIREVLEETSLIIVPGKALGSFIEEYKNKTIEVTVYETLSWVGDVSLSEDHTDFCWAAPNEIIDLDCWPYLYKLVANI